ncbi:MULTISPECIES: DUF262 domain-containing protein [Deinococcus]|uniref:DUF262 domain-containing protein n=1 Tax=Deinococcus rufus TaxID=2136097 RepID=A0ABV7ZDS3_9DEIO|nr:DUF262 domain-containing protein [Deinococcus sp. AB2017081]WQE96807.1 DUF262 domain-containing protein [Deinococcus sp. AB2017081]
MFKAYRVYFGLSHRGYEVTREILLYDDSAFIELKDDKKPIILWEEKQKEIVTSVVDYNLDTLDTLIRKQMIDLKPKYQRRFRWDDLRKSRLIESLLMNVPIPPIFLNEDTYGKYSVIDGKQRLTAISDFLNDRFDIKGLYVFSELNGKKFSEFPEDLQTVITTRPTLRAIIILRQSDPDIKFEVFERLNTGGVKLNAQELRNSTFTGSLNDLILDLSEDAKFHRLLRITAKSKSTIYKEMKDAELVLRFFTFVDNWKKFRGGVARTMDEYMAEFRHLDDQKIESMRRRFIESVNKIEIVFGENAFRRWNQSTGKWRAPIIAALYDAQMIAVDKFPLEYLEDNREKIVLGMQDLFNDVDFQKNINAAIPSYFIERIERVIDMITEAG